jgi:4-hydroxybutyryl-CoA synthetase (ADP-forming)
MVREDLMAKLKGELKLTTPIYIFPESAAKSLAALQAFRKMKQQKTGKVKSFRVDKAKVRRIINKALKDNKCQLGQDEVQKILECYGFKFPESRLAENVDKALKIAKKLGYPVVLKIDSPDILHKSDVGGIIIDIRNDTELKKGYKTLLERVRNHNRKAKINGVQVQKMVKGGKETILGVTLDPNFGPLVMFGMGGIYVEVIRDVSFRIVPVSDVDAVEMIDELKGSSLLRGIRGERAINQKSIVEHIQRLSQMVTDFHEIEQMDMNPIVFFPGKVTPLVLDARITLCPQSSDDFIDL